MHGFLKVEPHYHVNKLLTFTLVKDIDAKFSQDMRSNKSGGIHHAKFHVTRMNCSFILQNYFKPLIEIVLKLLQILSDLRGQINL